MENNLHTQTGEKTQTTPSAAPSTFDKGEVLTVEELQILQALGGGLPPAEVLKLHLARIGGKERWQQLELLEHIVGVLERDPHANSTQHSSRWGFFEAGTGTGKSYAYLLPTVLLPGSYLIATSTNQLGEQLFFKDLPSIRETLNSVNHAFTYALLKGKNNYICKLKVKENEQLEGNPTQKGDTTPSEDLFGEKTSPATPKKFAEENMSKNKVENLYQWIKTTTTGERSEGPSVPDKVWNSVSAMSSECLQSNCPFYSECFAYDAVKRASEAKIVVTNHAYLAHRLKNSAEDDNLSNYYDGIIIDEAHDFLDAVSKSFTETFSVEIAKKVLTNAEKVTEPALSAKTSETLTGIAETLTHLASCIETTPAGEPLSGGEELFPLLTALRSGLRNIIYTYSEHDPILAAQMTGGFVHAKEAKRLTAFRKLENLLDTVSLFVAQQDSDNVVIWVEQSPQGGKVVKIAHVNVGHVVESQLGESNMVATSATLTYNNSFDSIVEKFNGTVGTYNSGTHNSLTTSAEIVTEKISDVFHYPTQGLLYIPSIQNVPEPVGRERVQHTKAVMGELVALVHAAQGRTLALFTTTKEARDAADMLREQFPHLNILKHGEETSGVLVKKFVSDETSVLCGTMGMWQGVDAPGPTCSLVFINKVAFPPPSDVLNQAKISQAEKNNMNGFANVILPQVSTTLAQAVGRLIRSETDTGVVAIMDPRLLTKQYGESVLKSLPDFTLTTNKTDAVKKLHAIAEKANEERVTESEPVGGPKKEEAYLVVSEKLEQSGDGTGTKKLEKNPPRYHHRGSKVKRPVKKSTLKKKVDRKNI